MELVTGFGQDDPHESMNSVQAMQSALRVCNGHVSICFTSIHDMAALLAVAKAEVKPLWITRKVGAKCEWAFVVGLHKIHGWVAAELQRLAPL